MSKTRSVMAIRCGSVIDHVPAGQGIKVLQVLGLSSSDYQITVGLNLSSERVGRKDLIKITDKQLSAYELSEVGVFAPQATINIIEEFQVSQKMHASMPDTISGLLRCPNINCISRYENIKTQFAVQQHKHQVELRCHYCECTFPRAALEEDVL